MAVRIVWRFCLSAPIVKAGGTELPMTPLAVQAAALLVTAASAAFGLYTYWRSTRTKAAEFLSALHRAFFVEQTYRPVREILDDDSETAAGGIAHLVTDQPADFTDFLNFFELVAYMGKCGTLSEGDVEALLGYYLQILTDKPQLRGYVHNKKNNFEHLDKLLTRREARHKRKGR